MASPRHILTAVAWPYASGPRHIGHVAGFGVPSDVFSRYQRMAGNNVLMVSGTDEHGTPILVAADKEGLTPKGLADRYNKVITEDLRGLGLTYDLFTRTSTRNHYSIAQEIFLGLHRNGYVDPEDDDGRGLAVAPAARCRTATSRAPARSAATTAPAATSATTAATSSTPSRPDQPGQQDQRRDAAASSRRSTSSSTCPRSPRRWGPGCSPRAGTGGPTSSSSP